MNFESISLGLFFYSAIIVSNIGETCAENEYYSLTTTYKETEDKVFYDVHHQSKTLFGSMKNAIVHMLPNICNIWWEVRMKFCHDILETAENGFSLWAPNPENLTCNNVSFLVHFSTRSTLRSSTSSAFFCPQICYEDLETDRPACLPPYLYAVSTALERTSALIFVRKDSESVWLPQHHVSDIDFQRIEPTRDKTESSDSATQINDEDSIKLYLEAKRTTLPYEKFKLFFASINLCGLRRADKVHLCRGSIEDGFLGNTNRLKFDLFGYDEHACKRYAISPFDEVDGGDHFPRPNELTMVRCPSPVDEFSAYISTSRRYFDFYYIASNLKRHSTTLFVRRNKKGELPTQEANIENLTMKAIARDVRRWRFLPADFKTKYGTVQREKTYREVADELMKSTKGDVRMPSTLARLDRTNLEEMLLAGGVLKPSLNKWLADDSVIAFSAIKTMKSIYGRFQETYQSIDMGQLSMRQKAVLCNDALELYENPQDVYRMPETYVPKRSAERVRLTRREADGLETNTFLLFECPCDKRGLFQRFFVGKNHLKNTATIYTVVEIMSKPYYYPHAFVSGINRYKLALIILPSSNIKFIRDD